MTGGSLDRTKLASVLGMLGSAADGERAAAGLLATRMVKAAGLSWADVLAPVSLPAPPAHRPRSAGRAPMQTQHRAALAMCQHLRGHLTIWEESFIASIAGCLTLTPRQAETLLRVAAELPGRARR